MIDLPCQLEGFCAVHPWNVLAEELNYLLVCMTLAIEYNDPRVDSGICAGAGRLYRDGGCEGGCRACHRGEF
jgi:hypothetical protein